MSSLPKSYVQEQYELFEQRRLRSLGHVPPEASPSTSIPAQRSPSEELPVEPLSAPRPFLSYLGYAGYFIGVGQISGGIVHYSVDPGRYGLIAAVGVVVFLAGAWINEVLLAPVRPGARGVVRIVLSSLILSLGVGMLSGGLQHFADFPEYAAKLIPLGLVLSFAGFAWKRSSGGGAGGYRALLFVASLAAAAWLILPGVAANMTPSGHDHGPASSGSHGGEHVPDESHDPALEGSHSEGVPHVEDHIESPTDVPASPEKGVTSPAEAVVPEGHTGDHPH